MMSFKNCIRIRITSFWRLAYFATLPIFCEQAFSLGGVRLARVNREVLYQKKLGVNIYRRKFLQDLIEEISSLETAASENIHKEVTK